MPGTGGAIYFWSGLGAVVRRGRGWQGGRERGAGGWGAVG